MCTNGWVYHKLIIVTFVSGVSRSCHPLTPAGKPAFLNRLEHPVNSAQPEPSLSSPTSLSETVMSDRPEDRSLSPVIFRKRIFEESQYHLLVSPTRLQRAGTTAVCDQPIMEAEESSECFSENETENKVLQLESSTKATRTVMFHLRRRRELKEVTMVASWSGWREHIVLFHRNRFGYEGDEGRLDDDHSSSCVEVSLPNGTHHFKVLICRRPLNILDLIYFVVPCIVVQ